MNIGVALIVIGIILAIFVHTTVGIVLAVLGGILLLTSRG